MLDLETDTAMGAFFAARSLNMGNTIFKNVPIGATFRFANSDKELRKVSIQRYSDGTQTFETGQRTAVFR